MKRMKKGMSLLLVCALLLISCFAVGLPVQAAENIGFESNLGTWVSSGGKGEFTAWSNPYGIGYDAAFCSSEADGFVYTASDFEITGEKSFQLEVKYTLVHHSSGGAEHGWLKQAILLGAENAADPAKNSMRIEFTKLYDEKRFIDISGDVSGNQKQYTMSEEMANALSHRILIEYSAEPDLMRIMVDGAFIAVLENVKEDIRGKVGFGSQFGMMAVEKAIYTETEPAILKTFTNNLGEWTSSGAGVFQEMKDPYNCGYYASFGSEEKTNYVYATADYNITGEESFTLEFDFDLLHAGEAGAANGWCYQGVLLGATDAQNPAEGSTLIQFTQFPESMQIITVKGGKSGFSKEYEMTEAMAASLSHKVVLTYSAASDTLKISVDGEEVAVMTNAKADIQGKVAIGSCFGVMAVSKAFYTKTADPVVPTNPDVPNTETGENGYLICAAVVFCAALCVAVRRRKRASVGTL